MGDGNCLFRALSDQLYGSPSYHLKLRQDICDWIDSHKQRYEPFVEDERGLDVHLRCMRQQGTYGGHLELSAFAHLNRRDVKVMQPGLVYVIEWAAGWDPPEALTLPPPSVDESQLDEREKRRLRRDRWRSEQEKAKDSPQKPVYVAYYDWEHFDSIRNLKGPHTGIPNVIERSDGSPRPSSPAHKAKRKPESKPSKKASVLKPVKIVAIAPPPPTPSQVPLPTSRSPSPAGLSDPSSSNLHSPYPALPNLSSLLDTRVHRSPKRTFDESSASSHSETSESVSKRPRSSNPSPSRLTHETPQTGNVESEMDVDVADADADTPGLSPSGFSSESSLSPLSSPSPSAASPAPEVRLTRRQRKALGLPKARSHIAGTKGRASGKIVIPGGKFRKGGGAAAGIAKKALKVEEEAEWAKNGTGRVDVRGFRELKI